MRRLFPTILLCALPVALPAGEIPGLPPSLPPIVDYKIALASANDFLGRGGSVDDFRTQQIMFVANIEDRWRIVADHSILTLSEPTSPGRIDQLAVSLGATVYQYESAGRLTSVATGLGLRSAGEFAGERIQNGFHRLIGSDIENLPYSNASGTDATAWIDGESYRPVGESGAWTFGYWLRGTVLVTSGGQFDGALSAVAVATRRNIDTWAGLRRDWRSGYDEPVQVATADAEEDLALLAGVRLGGLIIETVQQFENDASSGTLRLLSLEANSTDRVFGPARFGLELGFTLPDVHLHLAGRFATAFVTRDSSAWRESVFVSLDHGEPQDADPTLFRRSTQLAIGLEWERTLSVRSDWIVGYASLGAGWRREQLLGDGERAGEASSVVDRAVLAGSAGLRFLSAGIGDSWRYRIQAGLSAWAPAGSDRVILDDREVRVQKPGVVLSLGVSFDFG